jgi:predicted nucleic acid-binding Zn ribbon protein
MKKSNEQTLKEVILELIEAYQLGQKLDEAKLLSSWPKVTGKIIARHTTTMHISKKVLFIYLDSPALKQELSYSKEKLIRLLNKKAGKEVIVDIVLR